MTKALRVEFSTVFLEQREAAPAEIKRALRDALALFIDEPGHPSLRNHPLRNEYAGSHSIDITEDWRAIYRESETGTTRVVTFRFLGTHRELYG